MPFAFNLETREGFRLLEFDPDVIRGRDVRILVDGQRVADMPYPRPAIPFQEVAFPLGEHKLIAAAFVLREAEPALGPGIGCDLFVDGRSLSGGPSLADLRSSASDSRTVYPNAFRVVDATLSITPAAAGPAMFVGLSNSLEALGLSTVVAIGAVLLGSLGLAVAFTRSAWKNIRADETRSIRKRAAIGWGLLIGSYGAAFVFGLLVAVFIRESAA
jgi:hypothetical protein